jgi:hypothetical protein
MLGLVLLYAFQHFCERLFESEFHPACAPSVKGFFIFALAFLKHGAQGVEFTPELPDLGKHDCISFYRVRSEPAVVVRLFIFRPALVAGFKTILIRLWLATPRTVAGQFSPHGSRLPKGFDFIVSSLCHVTVSGSNKSRSQPPLALSVPLSRFTPRVGGGSA